MIALEALLLRERSEGELRFRLALFGAHYLGRDGADRGAIFRDFHTVYDARSDIVHGVKRYRLDEVQVTARLARRLASAVFLKALDTGWPTQEQLRGMALSQP